MASRLEKSLVSFMRIAKFLCLIKPQAIDWKVLMNLLFGVGLVLHILLMVIMVFVTDDNDERIRGIQIIPAAFVVVIKASNFYHKSEKIESMTATLKRVCVPEEVQKYTEKSNEQGISVIKFFFGLTMIPVVLDTFFLLLTKTQFLPSWLPRSGAEQSKLLFVLSNLFQNFEAFYSASLIVLVDGFLIFVLIVIKGYSDFVCNLFFEASTNPELTNLIKCTKGYLSLKT